MAVFLVLVLIGVSLASGSDSPEVIDCPMGSPRPVCIPDPCESAQCLSYPDATCRTNNCHYCKAEFLDKNGQVVDCDKDAASSCVGGPVVCDPVDPCMKGCGGKLFTHCKRKRCKCEADFFFFDKKMDCVMGPKDCPPEKPAVQCELNMCQRVKCLEHKNAKCVLITCGECKTIFLDENGKDLKCEPTPDDLLTCPSKTLRRPCRDLCKGASCEAFPRANCSVDGCNNCKREFTFNDREVNCKKSAGSPSVLKSVKSTNKLKLICHVSGRPAPKVTWLKDGHVITPCESAKRCNVGYHVTNSKKTSKLVFQTPLTDDLHGIYTCRALNENGEASADYKVPAVTDQP